MGLAIKARASALPSTVSLLTRDYDYELPGELIARHPLARRDDARMMVLRRGTGVIEHRRFGEFPTFLTPGDLVVLNNTKVVPARVYSDDRRIELLFLEMVRENAWKCLVRPGKRMRTGATVQVRGATGTVVEICPEGERVIAFDRVIDLDAIGELPLPPYLERAPEGMDAERYQTVFARANGAVAAPTAGLHFTPEILDRVPHTFLTLHVGSGTFRPVQVDDLSEHRMHAERYSVTAEAAAAVNAAGRIVAVGTTTTRVLESCGRPLTAHAGSTSIFIHPPHRFRAVDVLLTNFHLPRSTLLMLVSAFAGREFTLEAYRQAITERYRFYSYGDCMLILP